MEQDLSTKKEGQIGKVISLIGNDRVMVKVERHPTCKSCGACNLGFVNNNEKTVEVDNSVNASVGDLVVLGVRSGAVLSASFILYVIPLLALIGGLIGGNLVASEVGMDPDVLSVIAGGTLLVLAFTGIRIYDRKVGKKSERFTPYITRLASEKEIEAYIDNNEGEESGEGSF